MLNTKYKSFLIILFTSLLLSAAVKEKTVAYKFLIHEIDPTEKNISFYWENDRGENFGSFQNLRDWLETKGKRLLFATNGGMFNNDFSPKGLFIENGILKAPLDTIVNGYGNFYLQPNGVFYLRKDFTPVICKTSEIKINNDILFATQSGPLLLIDGRVHPKFNEGSKNLNIRNGVGILPNGKILFAMSKAEVNFYDFASYFRAKGCTNALYLDGFVSRTYLPSKKYKQIDGNFGVIIAQIE
jgi:uncharacterized protein YigE (DUF2233 family)